MTEATQSPPRNPATPTRGARLVLRGFRILLRERRLWGLAAAPVLLAVLLVGAAGGLTLGYAEEIHAWGTAWHPELAVEAWYQWLWLGPALAGLWLLGWLTFVLALALAVVAAFFLANALAAPVLDELSRRVESAARGRVDEGEETGLRALLAEGGRAIRGELQRTGFFLGIWLVVSVAGVIIPGGALVTPFLLTAITVLFLPLDYAAYTLDRRRVPFRERRRWILGRLPLMTGFGAAAFAVVLVPVVNFLAIPALVAAGTLLVVDHPPESSTPATSVGDARNRA
ncbi:MAG: EI24 domain-containing protein [Proteobacteria bacterium]|nr:EI24 domain-containing protein [Pseudomonadota bacterium]